MKIWIIAGFMLFSSVVSAEFYTGNYLIENLKSVIENGSASSGPGAFGYVNGVAESLSRFSIVCFPDGVSYGQTNRVVYEYLKAHPQRLHESAFTLISSALYDAWPCAKN